MSYYVILLYCYYLFRAFLIAHSYSVDMAEKNKGSLDMVRAKFGDRNVVTFLPLLRK